MVNYPHQISRKIAQVRPKRSNRVDFANRGMSFESAINATNDYYLSRGLAVIHKKPTPVQIVKVDYPKRSRAKIVEAYFRQASTTDYSGVYKGYYIDFEAKETRQKTSMPMKTFMRIKLSTCLRSSVKMGSASCYFTSRRLRKPTFCLPKT